MSRWFLVTLIGGALLVATSTEVSAAGGRARPVRKIPTVGADGRPAPVVTPAGGNALPRPGAAGTLYSSASRSPAARAHNDKVRAHAWSYAARLRRTGIYLRSGLFGVGVGLSSLGIQVGKALSNKPLDSFLETITSPYVIAASFVPTLVAVLIGELVRNRYINRAQAIEASVHESYQADLEAAR